MWETMRVWRRNVFDGVWANSHYTLQRFHRVTNNRWIKWTFSVRNERGQSKGSKISKYSFSSRSEVVSAASLWNKHKSMSREPTEIFEPNLVRRQTMCQTACRETQLRRPFWCMISRHVFSILAYVYNKTLHFSILCTMCTINVINKLN